MQYIAKPQPNSNTADPANALRRKREAFAAGVGEDHDGFLDRSPAAISVIRAAMWGNAK